MSASVAAAVESDRGFYRDPFRVALLAIVAPVAYELWWLWQLVAFTRREGFPRARRFWWYLIPIYGWVLVKRQFDELRDRCLTAGVQAFNPLAALALFAASESLARFITSTSNATSDLIVVMASGICLAACTYAVQGAANRDHEARHPGDAQIGPTWGELLASLIGLAILATYVLAAMSPELAEL